MTFFSAKKLKPRKIKVDADRINSKSPEVQQRLDRIQDNYQQLDSILAELEAKIQNDERLKAMDDAYVEFESADGGKRKRKWRSGKPPRPTRGSRSRVSSTPPKKPR